MDDKQPSKPSLHQRECPSCLALVHNFYHCRGMLTRRLDAGTGGKCRSCGTLLGPQQRHKCQECRHLESRVLQAAASDVGRCTRCNSDKFTREGSVSTCEECGAKEDSDKTTPTENQCKLWLDQVSPLK